MNRRALWTALFVIVIAALLAPGVWENMAQARTGAETAQAQPQTAQNAFLELFEQSRHRNIPGHNKKEPIFRLRKFRLNFICCCKKFISRSKRVRRKY